MPNDTNFESLVSEVKYSGEFGQLLNDISKLSFLEKQALLVVIDEMMNIDSNDPKHVTISEQYKSHLW
jgi:hypothetical protein